MRFKNRAAIQEVADEAVCLHSPESFYAVGHFFENFSEVTAPSRSHLWEVSSHEAYDARGVERQY